MRPAATSRRLSFSPASSAAMTRCRERRQLSSSTSFAFSGESTHASCADERYRRQRPLCGADWPRRRYRLRLPRQPSSATALAGAVFAVDALLLATGRRPTTDSASADSSRHAPRVVTHAVYCARRVAEKPIISAMIAADASTFARPLADARPPPGWRGLPLLLRFQLLR